MFRVFIIGNETTQLKTLSSGLTQHGFNCSIISYDDDAVDQVVKQNPNLILIAADSSPDDWKTEELVARIKRNNPITVIFLLLRESLDSIDLTVNMDDFVLDPWDATEVVVRAKRILRKTNLTDDKELIKCEDLTIDQATCEVTIGGKLIELTFKEYELLIFLASNRGRVFTREALLDKVWGYDYFGGDRTVDVHIRRLRSKIEDPNHTFIETVRNIGYRFKKE